MGDAHATAPTSSWLDAGQPRTLSRLERQAPAAGRARAVRLRERGPHPQPVDRRRASPTTTAELLRRTAPACRRATSILESRLDHDRGAADDARPARAVGRSWPRSTPGSSTTARTRTRPNVTISYYTKGAVLAFLLDARDPQGDQRREEPRRRDARRLCEVLGRARASPRTSSAQVAEQVAGTQPEPLLG